MMKTIEQQSDEQRSDDIIRCDQQDLGQRRINVCHLSLSLQTGGLERLLVEFARRHDADRFQHEFVALKDFGPPAEEIIELGCDATLFSLSKFNKLQRVTRLAEFLRSRNIDVLHTHNAFPLFYGSLAARLAGISTVVHTRHGRRFGRTFSERLQFQIAGRLVDRIVGVSADTAELCREIGKFPEEKVSTILNGVDTDRFAYRPAISKPVAITVGRQTPEKDLPTLLQAVRLVVNERPEFQLHLIGDGPEQPRLIRLVEDLDLAKSVVFHGEQQDIPSFLSESGFYVSSSVTEGISLTILEAMSVGLPVVATDVGGTPEIVVPGETGLLVPSENPEALAAGILNIWSDRVNWIKIGENARRRVEQVFSINSMIKQYEQLYLELIAK